jgi:hypothetical protein
VRCPACGARNTGGADWCTQCYASLGEATPPPPVEVATSPLPDPPPEGPATATATSATSASARDVRTVGDDVEWRCARCRDWSPLLADACTTCGGPRTGFGGPVHRPAPGPTDRGRATAASVLLPGLGHLLAGRVGTGIARLVLGLSWLVGGVAIAAGAGGGGRALPAIPLLLGAVTVWAASIRDAAALGTGRELLRPRVLAGLTVAVVGTLLLAAVAATTSGAGTG